MPSFLCGPHPCLSRAVWMGMALSPKLNNLPILELSLALGEVSLSQKPALPEPLPLTAITHDFIISGCIWVLPEFT